MYFNDWKDTKDLELVCNNLLSNADLDYSFTDAPLKIELVFNVFQSDIKVRFSCSEISYLAIEKDYDDVPLHLVLEVHVSQENDSYCIEVMPEFNLTVKCKKLDWRIEEFSYAEQEKFYSQFNFPG